MADAVDGTRTSSGKGFVRVSHIKPKDGTGFKLDDVAEPSPPPRSSMRTVHSIMARFVPHLTSQHPELGGFELPALPVHITAFNKLDALHTLTIRGGLSRRVRDVFDLAYIAQSEHADQVRLSVPQLADQTARKEPRPASGYGSSNLYTPGSLKYDILQAEYQHTMSHWVPASIPVPDFAVAMRNIRDLDSA